MGIILAILLTAVYLVLFLFTHMAFTDSVITAVAVGWLLGSQTGLHPAFCLLIGVSVFIFLYAVQSTRIGYWTVSTAFSLIWAFFVGVIVHESTGGDDIWTYVSMGIAFFIILGFHRDTQ